VPMKTIKLTRWDLEPWRARYMERVRVGGPDACWPWTAGKRLSRYKYGSFHLTLAGERRDVTVLAHRLALYYFGGRIVDVDEDVTHLCANPSCQNPAHLVIVKEKQLCKSSSGATTS